jgi:hypothetical protein
MPVSGDCKDRKYRILGYSGPTGKTGIYPTWQRSWLSLIAMNAKSIVQSQFQDFSFKKLMQFINNCQHEHYDCIPELCLPIYTKYLLYIIKEC